MINEHDLQPKQKRIEFDSHRISWAHQHGHFNVTWKHSMFSDKLQKWSEIVKLLSSGREIY